MKKKISPFVFITILCGIMLFSFGLTCYASTVPTSASFSYYVKHTWLNLSGGHTIAYNTGKNATIGSGSAKYLFLDFGRQRGDSGSSDGWGVKLPDGDLTTEYDSWVKSVVEEFRNGYDAGHTVSLTIVVGTNNDESDWTQNGDSRFSTAGTKWATLVKSITGGTYSIIRGGNDFEGWVPTGGGFSTYGSDAVNWLTSYTNVGSTGLYYNYGDECYNESGSPYWSQYQVYQVSYGISVAEVLPEVYNTTAQPTQWATLTTYMNTNYSDLIFYNGIIGDSSWSTGWTNFNNDLVNAGFYNYLDSSASWGL